MRDPVPERGARAPTGGAAGTAAEAVRLRPQELEREAWVAMALRHGPSFFREHMADDGVVVVPGAVRRKDEAIAALSAQDPWEEFHFADERVVELRPDVHLVTYRVRAKRPVEPWYHAVVTSAYAADATGRWRLTFQQQTPQPPASEPIDSRIPRWSTMPLVDEHVAVIGATPDHTWDALLDTVADAFSGTAAQAYAAVVGCSDTAPSGLRPLAEGSKLAGFRVERAVAASELALTGRHHFASYRLIFRLDPLGSGSTRLSAESRADFRGRSSRAYRLLVRDTGIHAALVRRLLRTVSHRAERHVRN